MVIPTAYGRIGDHLYLHGAPANATLRHASPGIPVCVTVTLVDGLVLARSAFHHSINYRSVVIFGTATEVTADQEKHAALAAVVEHIVPGRGAHARPPTTSELRATRVVRVPLQEASAKVRTGGPKDDPEDLDLPVWAGQVPLRIVPGAPVARRQPPAPGAGPRIRGRLCPSDPAGSRRHRPRSADRASLDSSHDARAHRRRCLHRPAVHRQPCRDRHGGRLPRDGPHARSGAEMNLAATAFVVRRPRRGPRPAVVQPLGRNRPVRPRHAGCCPPARRSGSVPHPEWVAHMYQQPVRG